MTNTEQTVANLLYLKRDYLMGSDNDRAIDKAIALIEAQDEVIRALLKVGYPHNFQREEPWIVNYMYAITDVIKKAVKLG